MPDHDPFLDLVIPELDRLLATVDSARPGVLVALSGGADSTALLRAAVARREAGGAPVEAAHLDHGLRGADSEADAAFCESLCARWDVPLHLRRVDLGVEPGNREAVGRERRRAFFAEILDGAPRLAATATGHHRDDQLETLVMRFFRGAGPAGMRGIRPIDGRTIHPLLVVDRAGTEAYLRRLGQPWREDPSNADGSNVRARLRAELLPLAREILGPGVDTAPPRLAGLLAEDEDFLEAAAETRRAELDGDAPGLPVDALLDAPRPLSTRIVRRDLRDLGLREDLARVHLERLFDWLPGSRSGAGVDLCGGWTARREFDRLIFAPPGAESGVTPKRDVRILVRLAEDAERARPAPEAEPVGPAPREWRLTLPADALRGEPRLRSWRPGDRLVPFGMDGRKKVSDLLREKRVPAAARGDVLLVEDEAGPLWVVGVARAERTRLLPSHTTAVTLLIRKVSA